MSQKKPGIYQKRSSFELSIHTYCNRLKNRNCLPSINASLLLISLSRAWISRQSWGDQGEERTRSIRVKISRHSTRPRKPPRENGFHQKTMYRETAKNVFFKDCTAVGGQVSLGALLAPFLFSSLMSSFSSGSDQVTWSQTQAWVGRALLPFLECSLSCYCSRDMSRVDVYSTLEMLTSNFTIATVFEGDCGKKTKISVWCHLLINACSTLLLSASNNAMPCLSAPTRSNVDNAHASGSWLDIGIPSTRNLRTVGWKRVVLWAVLGLSSLPLHLLCVLHFRKRETWLLVLTDLRLQLQ